MEVPLPIRRIHARHSGLAEEGLCGTALATNASRFQAEDCARKLLEHLEELA